jgi:gluconate 5-dehydrogenase
MARALKGAGAAVVLLARDPGRVHAAASEIGAHAVSADLSDRAALQRAADAVVGLAGEPDILVNAAAINPRPPLAELTTGTWDETIEVNLTAPFLLGQRFGPAMAERGWGRIINLASQQAMRAFGNSGHTGCPKGGIVSLTRSQAEAWSSRGVCCNAVSPGFVRTPMTEPVFDVAGAADALAARTLIGRNGTADDFAASRCSWPATRRRTHRPVDLRGRRVLRPLTRCRRAPAGRGG